MITYHVDLILNTRVDDKTITAMIGTNYPKNKDPEIVKLLLDIMVETEDDDLDDEFFGGLITLGDIFGYDELSVYLGTAAIMEPSSSEIPGYLIPRSILMDSKITDYDIASKEGTAFDSGIQLPDLLHTAV